MPTIQNVGGHVDDLHDGRPAPRFVPLTVTDADLELPHYQQRIADGRFIVMDEPEPENGSESEESEPAEPEAKQHQRPARRKQARTSTTEPVESTAHADHKED